MHRIVAAVQVSYPLYREPLLAATRHRQKSYHRSAEEFGITAQINATARSVLILVQKTHLFCPDHRDKFVMVTRPDGVTDSVQVVLGRSSRGPGARLTPSDFGTRQRTGSMHPYIARLAQPRRYGMPQRKAHTRPRRRGKGRSRPGHRVPNLGCKSRTAPHSRDS
jgi:hypothetical protein